MNTRRVRIGTTSAVLLALTLVASQAPAGSHNHAGHGARRPATPAQTPAAHDEHAAQASPRRPAPKPEVVLSSDEVLETMHWNRLPEVKASIDRAVQHLEAGNPQAVAQELRRAQLLLAALQDMVGRQVKPQFANTLCPIMGTPIQPEKVTKALTRVYGPQKVAFCCAGCPAAWERLSNAEKQAKLKAAATSGKADAHHTEFD